LKGDGLATAAFDQGMVYFINGNYHKAVDSWQKSIHHDAAGQRDLEAWIEKAKAQQSSGK